MDDEGKLRFTLACNDLQILRPALREAVMLLPDTHPIRASYNRTMNLVWEQVNFFMQKMYEQNETLRAKDLVRASVLDDMVYCCRTREEETPLGFLVGDIYAILMRIRTSFHALYGIWREPQLLSSAKKS